MHLDAASKYLKVGQTGLKRGQVEKVDIHVYCMQLYKGQYKGKL